MFHKEGYQIIAISTALIAGLFLLVDYLDFPSWLRTLLLGVLAVVYILVLQFFRNPKRITKLNDFHIVAPVDGKVVVIEEVLEKEYFNDKRRQISIFMSPLNVHVTRYPISGVIKFSKYHPGKYLVAWHPKSSEENERTTIVVENKTVGPILFRQIAGAMARRIVNYAKEGENAIQGNDSGFIKFGSRVDVFIPLDMKVNIELNQKTKGGETIIASYENS
ncbi:phosphatidylserine decarboxylase family protein [Flavobacteriaceae bacterium F08102]|nr:phosphatidylserine decarboxylase family protein [Flavobacteriaceae bacterium F08102]